MNIKLFLRAALRVICVTTACAWSLPASSVETPRQGGTLRYGAVSEVTSLDPQVYGGSAWRVLAEVLYSRLVSFDKDGVVVPQLAQRWEQPDARTLVFHLRPDVVFHDGTPLTADDVKFSLDRILDPATGAALHGSLQGATVAVIDPATVRVTSAAADATMLTSLAMTEASILSRRWVQGGANLKMNENGTGPFLLKSYEPAVRAFLERNPRYFVAGLPYLDAIDFRMIKNDDARGNALRSQSVDMIDVVPWKDINALRRNPAIKIDMAGGVFMSVWFNPSKKPFDDPRVRRAIAFAVDREAVSKAAFFGYGKPIYGAPSTPDSPYHNSTLDQTFVRDLSRARALLAEAGYPQGFETSMVVFQGMGIYTTTAQVIQANLKEVGIDLKLELAEWATLLDRKNRGDYQSVLYGTSLKIPDPDTYLYYYGAESTFWAKPVGFRDPELETILAQGRARVATEERRPFYLQAEQRIVETSPWVFINWREQAQGYSSRVQGYAQRNGSISESSPGLSLPTMWLK